MGKENDRPCSRQISNVGTNDCKIHLPSRKRLRSSKSLRLKSTTLRRMCEFVEARREAMADINTAASPSNDSAATVNVVGCEVLSISVYAATCCEQPNAKDQRNSQ